MKAAIRYGDDNGLILVIECENETERAMLKMHGDKFGLREDCCTNWVTAEVRWPPREPAK